MRMFQVFRKVLTRMFQMFRKGLTRTFQVFRKGLTRMFQVFRKGLMRMFQVFRKSLTRMFQVFHKGLTRMFQVFRKGLTRMFQVFRKGLTWMFQVFRKGLTRMFEADDEDCVFMETSRSLQRQPHMVLECIPLPREVGDMAPIYFKVRTTAAGELGLKKIWRKNGSFLRGWLPHRGKAQMVNNLMLTTRTTL